MGTINVSLPADGETIDAADYNTPINTIVGEINGNLDNANIASDAAIAGSKLASGGVDTTQLADGAATAVKRAGGFFVGSFTTNASTGNQAVTGVGFTPKLVKFSQLDAAATTAHFSAQGAMDENGNQYAVAAGGNLSNVFRYGSTSKCIAGFNSVTNATPELQGTFVSMDADGFTINLDIAAAIVFGFEAYA